MRHALSDASRGNRLIHLLFAVQLVSMGAMEMSGPFWPLHLKALSRADWIFAIAGVAVYIGPMLGIVLTSGFWGRIGDRVGHKAMMIRALLGLSLTQLGLAYANDVWLVLILRFVQGACAGYIAPAQAYGVSIVPAERRSRLFAYLQVSTNIGSLVGAVVGGLILDHARFYWINIAAAVLCAICAVTLAWVLPALKPTAAAISPSPPANCSARTSSAWRVAPVSGLLAITGMMLLSRMMTQTPFSLYVSTVFQADNWVVGLCYGLLAFGFVISASLWARYFERKSLNDTLQGMACIALACACLTLLAGCTRNLAAFIAVHCAWGVLLGATTPVLVALISRVVDSRKQGYILGIAQSTTQFSSIAGIALGGLFTQTAGLQTIYFFVSASYVLALVIVVLVRKGKQCRAGASVPTGR